MHGFQHCQQHLILLAMHATGLTPRFCAAGAQVGQRLIPLEPMYVILNLGMSESFGQIQYDKLPFPAQMKVDWVR